MYLAAPVLRQVQLGEKTSIRLSQLFITCKVQMYDSQGGKYGNQGHFPEGEQSKEDQSYILPGFCVLVTEMKGATSTRDWRDCYTVRFWKPSKG